MIYLDNAASTKIHDDVLDSMIPYLKEQYGNPSSIHRYGRLTRKAIEKARKQIAFLINADPSEILITSGGTESNNTALNGIAMKKPSSHIITSSIEHDAILEPCKKLSKNGFDVDYVSVDNFGMVDEVFKFGGLFTFFGQFSLIVKGNTEDLSHFRPLQPERERAGNRPQPPEH